MKISTKRAITAILLISVIFSCSIPAKATAYIGAKCDYPAVVYRTEDHFLNDVAISEVAAGVLYSYGLFNGAGIGANDEILFNIDSQITRQEAITMVVRLLGKEKEALSGTWEMPFSDVADWAKPYVGYAYTNNLTKGISDKSFGSTSPVTANQFLTFMLRALGYSDASGDFSWDNPYSLANELNILSPFVDKTRFLRGDAVILSFDTLNCCPKNSDATLLQQLQKSGAAVKRANVDRDASIKIPIYSLDDLQKKTKYIEDNFGSLTIYARYDSSISSAQKTEIINWAIDYSGMNNFYKNTLYGTDRRKYELATSNAEKREILFSHCAGLDYIHIDINRTNPYAREYILSTSFKTPEQIIPYHDFNILPNQAEIEARFSKTGMGVFDLVNDAYATIFKDGMTDYEKICAACNWIMNKVSYDYTSYNNTKGMSALEKAGSYVEVRDAHTWNGTFENNKVVCEGYVGALHLLLNMADVPCIIISGSNQKNSNEDGHAWNKVFLDGCWYNLDVTWMDGNGGINSKYFLKSDATFQTDEHGDYYTSEAVPKYDGIYKKSDNVFETMRDCPASKDYSVR